MLVILWGLTPLRSEQLYFYIFEPKYVNNLFHWDPQEHTGIMVYLDL